MYVKLSAIKGAANFNNLVPILSEPVALVSAIFLRYFSIVSQDISGIKKVSFGISSLQNCRSLSKLEFSIGSLIFDATFTKQILNSLAMSFEFSMIQSLILRENYLHFFTLT